jgi:hypothetical protein
VCAALVRYGHCHDWTGPGRDGGDGARLRLRTELREGLGGRSLHLPDGVVLSTDSGGKTWRTAVEVELTRKTEARVAAILRQLLATYDDVVYRAAPGAATVVKRAARRPRTWRRADLREAVSAGVGGGRQYPEGGRTLHEATPQAGGDVANRSAGPGRDDGRRI